MGSENLLKICNYPRAHSSCLPRAQSASPLVSTLSSTAEGRRGGGGFGLAAAVSHVLPHVEADGKCQTSVHSISHVYRRYMCYSISSVICPFITDGRLIFPTYQLIIKGKIIFLLPHIKFKLFLLDRKYTLHHLYDPIGLEIIFYSWSECNYKAKTK